MMRVKNDSGFSDENVITSVVTSAGRNSYLPNSIIGYFHYEEITSEFNYRFQVLLEDNFQVPL